MPEDESGRRPAVANPTRHDELARTLHRHVRALAVGPRNRNADPGHLETARRYAGEQLAGAGWSVTTQDLASHYARLLDTTIRAEWEASRDDDHDLTHLLPKDAEWANRARTALPNGHCGLPRQQSRDHSNKCLACPVFITTSTDLPTHEEPRRRTLTLIARFDQQGNTALADKNRFVLEQLEARIAEKGVST